MDAQKIAKQIEKEFRSILHVSHDVEFVVVRRVEGDDPVWLIILTDGLNERVLARSVAKESLQLEVRKRFGARGSIREFWERFLTEDPVFCQKALDEGEDEVEVEAEVDFTKDTADNFVQELVSVLRLLHLGQAQEAKKILANVILKFFQEAGLVHHLLEDEELSELYEVTIRVKGSDAVDHSAY